MSGVVITGWSAVSPAGVGRKALSSRDTVPVPVDVSGLFEDPLPTPTGHALVDFDVRAELGRKGTSFFDRATALAVVACGDALRDAGAVVDDDTRSRIGLVLGTSLGSFRSTSDYTRDTLVQDKPYLVNPVLFPNTVMNCAAGQAAIRYGLRGVNATVASGPLAFLGALRYGVNAIERGYVDAMLIGAVEEFSPHRAWANWLTTDGATPTGEGAAIFLITRADRPAFAGPRREAEVLALAGAFGPGVGPDDAVDPALAGCVRRVLSRAGVDPGQIATVFTGEIGPDDTGEFDAARAVLGRAPERVPVSASFGRCDAAAGALALADLLAGPPPTDGSTLALLTARSPDGGAAAAIVSRRSDAGAPRG